MTELKIKKYGGSFILNIPSEIMQEFDFKEDDWVDVDFAKVIKLKRVKIS